MNEFFLDIGISAILTVLRESVKNPKRKEQIRKSMLKVYKQIGLVFGGDEDFAESAISAHDLTN